MTTKLTAALSVLLLLPACASIIAGTEQKLEITSTPPGADCGLFRQTESDGPPVEIARVNPTPGSVTVEKTKFDIALVCSKPGYEEGMARLESGNEGATIGNVILGGGVGWAVDSARGADNKYPEFTNVPLAPLPAASTPVPEPTVVTPTPAAIAPVMSAPEPAAQQQAPATPTAVPFGKSTPVIK